MPLTNAELEELIRRGEDIYTDFKETLNQNVLNALSTDFCAFANSESGKIIIGVNDKKEVIGYRLEDNEGNRISQEASKCMPPVTINIEKSELNGKPLVIITIPKSNSIHKDKNHRFPIRIGKVNSHLDITGLVKLVIERFGLVYGKPIGELQIDLLEQRREMKREPTTEEESKFYLEKLESENSEVRTEAIKDLVTINYRKIFLSDDRVFRLIDKLLDDRDDSVKWNVLELLRTSFHYDSEEIKARIIADYSNKVINLALNNKNTQIKRNAITVLGLMNTKESIDAIMKVVTEIADDIYNQLGIPNLIAYVKSVVGGETIREKAFEILSKNISEKANNRMKEILLQARYG